MQVPQSLQDLSGVEDDCCLFQRTPLWPQQGRQASWKKETRSVQNLPWNGNMTKQLERPPGNPRGHKHRSLKQTDFVLWNAKHCYFLCKSRNVPPGTCSMKILMYLFSETEPRYWTMFLCFRYLWRAISSWSGWEYLSHKEERQNTSLFNCIHAYTSQYIFIVTSIYKR